MARHPIIIFMFLLGLSSFMLASCTPKESSKEEHSIMNPIELYSVNEDGVLVVINKLLWFHDFKTGEKAVVCNLPNCEHEPFHHEINPDPICLAAAPFDGPITAVNMYDNKAYIFGSELLDETIVYQIDLENSSRKELIRFAGEMDSLNTIDVIGGLAYFPVYELRNPKEKLDKRGREYTIMSLDFRTGEVAQYGEVKDGNYAEIYQFRKIGEKLYYLYTYIDWEGEYEFAEDGGVDEKYDRYYFNELDIATNEERLVLDLLEKDDLLYYFDQDHLYFLSEDKSTFTATNWEQAESEILFTGQDIGINSRLRDGFLYAQHEIYDGTLSHYDIKTKKTKSFKRPDDEFPIDLAYKDWIITQANYGEDQVDLVAIKREDYFAGKKNYTILREKGGLE